MTETPRDTPKRKKSALRRLGSGVGRLTRAKPRFVMPTVEGGLRVVIATDAWKPQLNGVVRTLDTLGEILRGFGNEVLYVTPNDFKSIPLPSYPEIRLSLLPNRKVAKMINEFQPDAVHIATEGPIGRATRRFCKRRGYPFTTSFHTRFAEYANERWNVPIQWGYAILKDFHNAGETMMVATPGLREELEERGFSSMKLWTRGVDLKKFTRGDRSLFDQYERPIYLYVGRLAVEKSIEDFIELDLPGTKVIVGEGPQREELEAKYKDAIFTGPKYDDDLTRHYQAADVFVFPSRTDTFGLVNVEALACGVPVASYPVRGPLEILDGAPPGCGAMNEDLRQACLDAYEHRAPQECRKWAENFSWEAASRQFIANLEIPGFNEEFWLRSAKMID
ncbi:MAG: glycosyltransferase family 1 protein [Alphaproteobacteria bacterium]|nr:glycosyltransferase family 1 protein [Alphaproteobacteria bacterium]